MQIKYNIQPEFKDPEIHICSDKMDRRTTHIYETVSGIFETAINGYREGYDEASRIRPAEIIRIFSANKKVYVTTREGRFTIRERLYEMEERFCHSGFVRISNSEIVNASAIRHIDTKLTGTIKMQLDGDIETYVSRRYVSAIKKSLGI